MVSDNRLATDLTVGPVGCAFLLTVEQNHLSPAVAVTHEVAFTVAALAVRAVWPHEGDHAEIESFALSQGPRLIGLARSLIAEPGAAWWFAPLARDQQLWIGREGMLLEEQTAWSAFSDERTSVKPAAEGADRVWTSTIVDTLSSELIAIREGAGDYWSQPPYTRYRLWGDPTARVYEITGPSAWHELSTSFPEIGSDGKVVPDWSAVAEHWDAVHLTFGGLLTAAQVRTERGGYATELRDWDAERTLWLHDRFAGVERWPDLPEVPVAAIDLAGWGYWGPTWNDDPKPWRQRLGRILPPDEWKHSAC